MGGVACLFVLGCVLFFTKAVHAQQPPEAKGLQANLENVLLEDFVKFMGQYTGRNIFYRSDQIPQIRFNIYSQQAISEPELYAIFNEVLNSVNLEAVSKGDVLYVMPSTQIGKMTAPLTRSKKIGKGEDDELVTTVYQVKQDLPSSQATQLLQNFKSPQGRIQDIPQAHAILIRDTRERIDKMLEVLDTIQSIRPAWGMEYLQLEEAKAGSVVKVLGTVFAELVKRGRTADVPFFQAVAWTNAVLFAGTGEQKREIRDIIKQLDKVQQSEVDGALKIYRLQNAKASSLAEVLKALVKVKQGEKDVTVNENFMVSADETTNSLLVVSTGDMVTEVEQVIKELDQPQDQVFIQALIMETSLDNTRKFGVEWMGAGAHKGSILGSVGFQETPSILQAYAEPVVGSTGLVMPALSAVPGGFSLGLLGNIITYGGKKYPTMGAFINFVKDVSEINILSTPQIMTLNNSVAEVFVGENRPFQTGQNYDSNNNPVLTYEYKDVGVRLLVTPYINSESGLVRMDIEQNVDKVASGGDRPTTLTRFTKTSVQLLDGSTMVISGMVEEDRNKGQSGVPGLANVPFLGWLFKRENTSSNKRTLMVFISAKIIRTLETAEALTATKMEELERAREEAKDYFKKEFEWNSSEEDTPEEVEELEEMSEGPNPMDLDVGPESAYQPVGVSESNRVGAASQPESISTVPSHD
jgi:general secretion pathway protein D